MSEYQDDAHWLQRTHPDLASEAGTEQFCERVAIVLAENQSMNEADARQLAADSLRETRNDQ